MVQFNDTSCIKGEKNADNEVIIELNWLQKETCQ